MNTSKLYFVLLVLIFFSCNRRETNHKTENRNNLELDKTNVETLCLRKTTFYNQILSNATLSSLNVSELSFQQTGAIENISIENGMHVSLEQILANVKPTEYKQQLVQNQLALSKAKLELQNTLIGIGYSLDDSLHIPKTKMELAKVRSGYAQAQLEYEKAVFQLEACTLKAPFSGVVANIKRKEHEQTNGEPFCTLIDDSVFDVNFQIMETELKAVSVGASVKVKPLALDNTFIGTIKTINPVVGEHGLVTVTARVKNTGGLMEGMNAQVVIEQEIPNQFVVPKSAVVLRQNQEVLFRVINGKAFWTYVITTNENSTSYAVIPNPEKVGAELNVGDTIIVSGNLNLAHESEVEIK